MSQQTSNNPRTFFEEVSIAGNQLVERVEALIKQGNIRRLIIRDQNGRTLLEIPLTIGVVAGAAAALYALPLALIGAVAGYVAKVQVVIERYENPSDAEHDTTGGASNTTASTTTTTTTTTVHDLSSNEPTTNIPVE